MRKKQFTFCQHCDKKIQKIRRSTKYCNRNCQAKHLHIRGIIGRKKEGKYVECINCKKVFYVQNHRFKKGNVKYCSRHCLAKIHLSQFSEFWFKPTKKIPRKYKTIIVNGKQIREHRWIMEQHLGRKLKTCEHIHHINGDPLDNRLENLQIVSNSEHQRIEHIERKKIIFSS
jgi:hypothetical protein